MIKLGGLKHLMAGRKYLELEVSFVWPWNWNAMMGINMVKGHFAIWYIYCIRNAYMRHYPALHICLATRHDLPYHVWRWEEQYPIFLPPFFYLIFFLSHPFPPPPRSGNALHWNGKKIWATGAICSRPFSQLSRCMTFLFMSFLLFSLASHYFCMP